MLPTVGFYQDIIRDLGEEGDGEYDGFAEDVWHC